MDTNEFVTLPVRVEVSMDKVNAAAQKEVDDILQSTEMVRREELEVYVRRFWSNRCAKLTEDALKEAIEKEVYMSIHTGAIKRIVSKMLRELAPEIIEEMVGEVSKKLDKEAKGAAPAQGRRTQKRSGEAPE